MLTWLAASMLGEFSIAANGSSLADDISDPLIMQQTVRECKKHNIKVGAHPGLPDIQGFGRREIKMSPEELTAMTRYQVGALKAFLDAEGIPLYIMP